MMTMSAKYQKQSYRKCSMRGFAWSSYFVKRGERNKAL